MRKRLKSITPIKASWLYPPAGVGLIVAVWHIISKAQLVPAFMLPSPMAVIRALFISLPELRGHAAVSLSEAFLGLAASLLLAVLLVVLMDRFEPLYKMLYPLMIISQTVPVVAVAPLLVLWLGYGIASKVMLIVIVCFFPLAVGLLDGFKASDQDILDLLKAMGAKYPQILIHAKLPGSLPAFFAGLKVAVSYSIVGAVIAEWLGGNQGLGVYMTRVRRSYAFDKMFAVILLITAISLLLMGAVSVLQKLAMPWKNVKGE